MPWPENEQRLALASRLGLNVSEILNEALEQRVDDVGIAFLTRNAQGRCTIRFSWIIHIHTVCPEQQPDDFHMAFLTRDQ